VALERLALRGEVDTEVRSPTLLTGERCLGDEAREEMRSGQELLEPGGIADEAAVAPKRRAELGRDGLGRGRIRNRGKAPRHRWLAERGKRGAPSEDEALEHRVRRQPVGAVNARRGALAGGIQAG